MNRLVRMFSSRERGAVDADVLTLPAGTTPEMADSIAGRYEENVEVLDPLRRLAQVEENGAIEQLAADLDQSDGTGEADTVGLREEVSHWRRLHDELAGALDMERPAPDPAWLGAQLRAAFYRPLITPGPEVVDSRWTAAAETAIDTVRGLWPPTKPGEPWPFGEQFAAEEIGTLDAAAERVLAAREELARVICDHEVEVHSGEPWERLPESEHDVFRAYAAAIQANWRGPGTAPRHELATPATAPSDPAISSLGDQITGVVETAPGDEPRCGHETRGFWDDLLRCTETKGHHPLRHRNPAGSTWISVEPWLPDQPETSPDGGEGSGAPVAPTTGVPAPGDPADTAVAGDPDPTRGGVGRTCPAFYNIWVCTRPEGHRGAQHLAGSGATVRATWRACPRCGEDVRALLERRLCDPCEAEVAVSGRAVADPDGEDDRERADAGSGAAPSALTWVGSTSRPPGGAHELDTHVDHLARALACRELAAADGASWAGAHPSFRETYGLLAADVLAAGWRPLGGVAPSRDLVPVIAALLTEHEPLLDDACRCGFAGTFTLPESRSPLWHAEHVAALLIESGVIAG